MNWWEEEQLLTEKDKQAIIKAQSQDWTEIDENSAETIIGKGRVHRIAMEKYHRDEYCAGIL